MTLKNMRYILAISQHHSFSKAAKALYISQSTLSSAVKEVETNLGITLFIRMNRGIQLTADGEDFIRYAKEIIEQTDLLEQRYQMRKILPMRFSVSTQHLPFATRAYIRFVQTLQLKHYDIAIRECNTQSVIDDVTSERSNLGVLSINDSHLKSIIKVLQTHHFEFYELNTLKSYVFVRSVHPLANAKSLTLKDLESFPFVTYDQSIDNSHLTEEPLFYNRLEKNIHVCDRCTKIALIRNANCFSIGPDLTNSNADNFHKGLGEIKAIPLVGEDSQLHIGYIFHSQHELDPICQDYLRFLKEDLSKLVQRTD